MNRGFTPWADRVLVIGRSSGSSSANVYIDHYSAATGEHIQRVNVGNEAQCPYYPGNDIFLDNAGNVVVTNLVLNIGSYPLRILQVDPETGQAVLRASLMATGTETRRIDHCNVLGDVSSNSFLVTAAMSSGTQLITWTVENGNVTNTQITDVADYAPASAENFGIAPRIWPVSNTIAYVSGGATYPTRYNLLTGELDDQILRTDAIRPVDYVANGFATFEMADKRYMLFPCNDHFSSMGYRFLLAQSDGGDNFADFEPLWRFPERGLGSLNSSTWGAPCYVTDDSAVQKSLYVYVPGNGIAAYTLSLNITGDVNADGKVDVADLNQMLNGILDPTIVNATLLARADLNGDGGLDVGDINQLINILLGL